MSRPYLVRLAVWLAVVAGIGFLVAQWVGRDRPHLTPSMEPAAPSPAPRAAVPPPAGAGVDVLGTAARLANRWLMWASTNWVFVAELALVLALGWGRFGKGLGAFDLIYAEGRLVRLVNGLLIGLMFGNLLYLQYLPSQGGVPWGRAESPGLFPVAAGGPETQALRRAGNFLLVAWLPVLALFYLPGAVAARKWSPAADPFPALGLGLAGSPLVVAVGVCGVWLAADPLGLPPDWRDLFARTPGAAAGVIPPSDYPLHLLAGAATLLPVAGLALAGTLAFAGRVACPVWVIALLIWLFNSLYGMVRFHFTGLEYVLAALAGLVVLVANGRHSYKLSLPNLAPEYAAARTKSPDFARLGDDPAGLRPVPLTTADELLGRFKDQYRHDTNTRGKPKLVLVAASGGGIRAAVWTAAMLDGLDKAVGPRFAKHIKIVGGASGGMVAAGLMAGDKVRPAAGRSLAHVLGKDGLWPVLQTYLVRDFPSLFLPFYRDWDRGYSLEAAWHRNAPALAPGDKSPWRTTFAELHAAERAGLAPALIFSPLLVEDGRRLLISNLDLGDLATESAPTLGVGADGKPDFGREQLSCQAVEFFRLFPAAHARFEVGTAARLNATFPFVSPSVNLPTVPPRRVVDAGYFDNYGVNLLAAWLHRNRAAVKAHCAGVALVEIRGFPMEAEKNGFDGESFDPMPMHHGGGLRARVTGTVRTLTATATLATSPTRPSVKADAGGTLVSLLAGVSTPAEALIAVRSAGAYFRNDQLLGILDAEFNTPGEVPFLVRVPFECPGEAALSWAISTADRDRILAHVAGIDGTDTANLRGGVRGLAAWFGTGGG